MISNILRMICVIAFLGIFLFNIATSINTQESSRKSQNFIKYKPLSERTAHAHQEYAPNIIYLGENNTQQGQNVIKLRSRTR